VYAWIGQLTYIDGFVQNVRGDLTVVK